MFCSPVVRSQSVSEPVSLTLNSPHVSQPLGPHSGESRLLPCSGGGYFPVSGQLGSD